MVDAIVPPPVPTEDDLARAANREPASRGIRYYAGPGFSEALEGAGAVLKAVDPAQGILRGMAASGRAFDSDLPADERRAAGIEALLETAAPIGMMGIGALAKQPLQATILDVLTPTGAPAVMNDAVEDVSRRAFLKGAAAAVPVAAVAPDVLTEALNAGTKASARVAAASSNPIGYSVSLIKAGTDQINDLVEAAAGRGEMAIGNRGEYKDKIFAVTDSLRDLRLEALADLTPSNVRNAGDAELDEFLRDFYEYNPMTGGNEAYDHPNFELVLQEIKRRGLHMMQDRGIDRYPFARAAMDDFGSTVSVPSGGAGISTRPTDLNMVRNLSDDIMSSVNELRIMAKRRELSDGLRVMQDRGDSLATQEAFVERMEREIAELQGNFTQLPPDMDDFYAEGGEVKRDDVPYPKPYNRAQGIINYFYLMMNPEKPEPEKPKPYVQARPRSQMESLGKQINFPGFAEGGEVSGIGSLNETARNMFRVPRFAEGGEVTNPALSNFVARVKEGAGDDREALEALANVEYAADMQKYLQDPLSRLGFDPDVVKTTTSRTMYPEDSYSRPSDTLTVDTNMGAFAPEVQVHEFRHRGMYPVIDLYFSDPERFEEEFGTPAAVYVRNILKDMRGPQNQVYSEALAEFYEQPSQFNYPRVYYSETGEVVQANEIDAYREANPGVATRAVNRKQDGHLTHFLNRNTRPLVESFREYKETGEIPSVGDVSTDKLRQMYEGAEGLQRAAEFLLERNPVRGYSQGGTVGVASLNETARGMFR